MEFVNSCFQTDEMVEERRFMLSATASGLRTACRWIQNSDVTEVIPCQNRDRQNGEILKTSNPNITLILTLNREPDLTVTPVSDGPGFDGKYYSTSKAMESTVLLGCWLATRS